MVKRVTNLGVAGLSIQTVRPTMMHAPEAAPAQSAVFNQFSLPEASATGAICGPLSPPIHFNSRHRSLAVCQRLSGSFAKQVFTTRSSAGGVMDRSVDMGRGSEDIIAEITLAWLLPSNALFPVAIS